MRQAVRAAFSWKQITDDELLEMRLCDLPVRIEGTPLEERVRRIRFELDESGLRFRPRVWLATAPGRWRKRYEGWGALQKLEYVDRLMQGVVGVTPKNRRREEVEPLWQ